MAKPVAITDPKVIEFGKYVEQLWYDGVQAKSANDTRNYNNYAYLTGHQHTVYNSNMRYYENYLTTIDSRRTRITVNKTRKIMEARASFIMGGEPTITVSSDSLETQHREAAYTAQCVAQADWQKNKLWEDIKDAWEWVKSCGLSYIQIYYNPNVGKFIGYDKDGDPLFEGGIDQRVRSDFETILDPLARTWKDVRYIVCASVFSIENAMERWPWLDWKEINKLGDNKLSSNTMQDMCLQLNGSHSLIQAGSTNSKGKQRNVLGIEYWEKPGRDAPLGRYVVSVGGQTVQYSPLEIGEIPFIPFYEIKEAGTLRGQTPVTEMRPLQEQLNKTVALDIERSSVADMIGLPYGGGWPLDFGGKALVVGRINPAMGEPIFVPGGSQRQDYMYKERYFEEKLEELGGVSSISARGRPSHAQQSGRSQYIITEASRELLTNISERFRGSVKDLVRKRLKYISKFYTTERTMGFINENDRQEVIRFKGAKIGDNWTVNIELNDNMENPQQTRNSYLQLSQSQLFMQEIMSNDATKKVFVEGINKKLAHAMFRAERPEGQAVDENYEFSQGGNPPIEWYQDDMAHYKEHVRCLIGDEVKRWPIEYKRNLEFHTMRHMLQEAARKRYMAMQQGVQNMLSGQSPQGQLTQPTGVPGQQVPTTEPTDGTVVTDVDMPLETATQNEYPGGLQQSAEVM